MFGHDAHRPVCDDRRPVWLAAAGALIALVLTPRPAHAYVDPGVVGMLFQAIFAMVFGFLLVFFTRPIQAVKRFWNRLRGRAPEPVGTADEDTEPSGDED